MSTVPKQNNKLPLNKYLHEASGTYQNCEEAAQKDTFDSIISNSFRKNRHTIRIPTRSVNAIWSNASDSFEKRSRLIAHLEQSGIDNASLEKILYEIFISNPSFFETANANDKSNLRRLNTYVRCFEIW